MIKGKRNRECREGNAGNGGNGRGRLSACSQFANIAQFPRGSGGNNPFADCLQTASAVTYIYTA